MTTAVRFKTAAQTLQQTFEFGNFITHLFLLVKDTLIVYLCQYQRQCVYVFSLEFYKFFHLFAKHIFFSCQNACVVL